MSLLIQNIQKSYGTKQVLKNGSLLAPKGSVTALIGKNGVGKTTTFKIVCGLISAEGGEVLWNKTKMHPTSMEWKKRIGYLPEHNPLYKDMYLREFLSLACQIHQVKNPSKRITEVIELVGLGEYTNFKINHLSKGYRQRVGLAQAIINDPEVIILDEPTSGLDPSQLVEVRALIKSLAKNKTVILSSHILSEVEQICDRIYMIQNGTIASLDDMKNDNIWLVRFDAEVSFSCGFSRRLLF